MMTTILLSSRNGPVEFNVVFSKSIFTYGYQLTAHRQEIDTNYM